MWKLFQDNQKNALVVVVFLTPKMGGGSKNHNTGTRTPLSIQKKKVTVEFDEMFFFFSQGENMRSEAKKRLRYKYDRKDR